MDTSGASALRDRLEQQRNWQLAPAVLDERLPRSDPDLPALREFGGDERFYEDEYGPFVKRLVDGTWQRFEVVPHR